VPPLIDTLAAARSGGAVSRHRRRGHARIGPVVLTYTRFGRYVYMVGGNREAAEYSASTCAPSSPRSWSSRALLGHRRHARRRPFRQRQPERVRHYLLDSISAVVVGGTSLFGGQGGSRTPSSASSCSACS